MSPIPRPGLIGLAAMLVSSVHGQDFAPVPTPAPESPEQVLPNGIDAPADVPADGGFMAPAESQEPLPPPPVEVWEGNAPATLPVGQEPAALLEQGPAAPSSQAPPLKAPAVVPPSGYSRAALTSLPDIEGMLDPLEIGLSATLLYESNFNQAPGTFLAPEEDETSLSVSPYIAYRSSGGDWSYGIRAALNYKSYFSDEDLGGLGYSAVAQLGYAGGPLSVSASLSSSYDQGVNRYYDNRFTETLNFGASLAASYELSARTSLDANFGASWSDPNGGGNGQTENYNFGLFAMWQATPLVKLGPGLSFSYSTGDTQTDRTTIGPALQASYKVTEMISANGRIGVDFVDYGGSGGSDEDLTYSLSLAYRPSELWGMDLTLYQGTQADGGTSGAFRETTSVSLDLHRKFSELTTGIGIEYALDDYSFPSPSAAPVIGGQSREFLNLRVHAGMPVFDDRVVLSTFFAWSKETGAARGNWDGYEVGLSLSSHF